MRRIILLFLVVALVSGCGRLQSGGNAENFDDTSRAGNTSPLSSDTANLPVPTPIPNPIVPSKSDFDYLEEICGNGNFIPYFCHALLSFSVNASLILLSQSYPSLYFLRILRMVSVFSFPVHAYLTNPSFLSKSKLSLTALAVDTCLSLYGFITKNPSIDTQFILEIFRISAYPHISYMLFFAIRAFFHVFKGAI